MDKVKDKGAIIVCAVAIVLIIVLLVVKGGQKNNVENANQNTNNQIENSVTEPTQDNFDILITALDENGNKLLSLTGVIDTVKPGETVQLNASVTADIANAYDFTVEKK